MFTGIIRKTAKVKEVEKTRDGLSIYIANLGLKVKNGDSICVDGVCSTVARVGKMVKFEYMPETLSRSNLGALSSGDSVNLEASLKVSDKLDGHIVLGHVDTIGKITAIENEGNSKVLTIAVSEPKRFMKFVAEKGSVAVDGVSLTVVDEKSKTFTVKLVPFTWENTGFKNKKVGAMVNLEFDILAKYLDRLIRK